jgi:hypothetical protein
MSYTFDDVLRRLRQHWQPSSAWGPAEPEGFNPINTVIGSALADLEPIAVEMEMLGDQVARLTRERDEAVAVAQDKREDLGFSWLGELTEWLNMACACGVSPKPVHAAMCAPAAWARRIGGLAETQRQVDASHEEALVEYIQRREAMPLSRSREEARRPVRAG